VYRVIQLAWLILLGVVVAMLVQISRGGDLPTLPGLPALPFALPFQGRQPSAPPPAPTPSSTAQLAARPLPGARTPTAVPATCGPRPFEHGFASLKEALGDRMGEPTECEHVVNADGDTEQHTSTGLAYYRKKSNLAVFTNGWDHWALTDNGVMQWAGEDVEPPPSATLVP
jgi:hypothetical protein